MASDWAVRGFHYLSRRQSSLARSLVIWSIFATLTITVAVLAGPAAIGGGLRSAFGSTVELQDSPRATQAVAADRADPATLAQPASSQCGFYGAPYGPTGAIYDSVENEIFVADSETNEVYVISAANQTLLKVISLGEICVNPFGLAYDSELGEIFVAEAGNGAVGVISDTNDSVVASFPIGNNEPWNIVLDSGLNQLFVTAPVQGNITVLSLPTGKVVNTIEEGRIEQPVGLSYAANLGEIFVANGLGNYSSTMSVISDRSDAVVSYVPIDCFGANTFGTFAEIPYGTAYNPETGSVYVSCEGGDGLAVVATPNNTQVGYVPLDQGTAAITYDASQNEIWVVSPFSNQAYVVSCSTNSVVDHGPTGVDPFEGIAIDNRTGDVYVTNFKQTNVTVLDSEANPIATISLPAPLAPPSGTVTSIEWLLILIPIAALVAGVVLVAIRSRPPPISPSPALEDSPRLIPENK